MPCGDFPGSSPAFQIPDTMNRVHLEEATNIDFWCLPSDADQNIVVKNTFVDFDVPPPQNESLRRAVTEGAPAGPLDRSELPMPKNWQHDLDQETAGTSGNTTPRCLERQFTGDTTPRCIERECTADTTPRCSEHEWNSNMMPSAPDAPFLPCGIEREQTSDWPAPPTPRDIQREQTGDWLENPWGYVKEENKFTNLPPSNMDMVPPGVWPMTMPIPHAAPSYCYMNSSELGHLMPSVDPAYGMWLVEAQPIIAAFPFQGFAPACQVEPEAMPASKPKQAAEDTHQAGAAEKPMVPSVLTREVSADGSVERFFFPVKKEKLRSTDRIVVSDTFELPLNGKPTKFKILMFPEVSSIRKHGASFKKSAGKGFIQLKCEEDLLGVSGVLTFRLFAGDPRSARGPMTHDFNDSAVKGLPKEIEIWNFDNCVADGHLVVGAEIFL